MRLVEIVVGKATGDDTVEMFEKLPQAAEGAIIVRRCPGFASSRLGVALGLELCACSARRGISEGHRYGHGVSLQLHSHGSTKASDHVGLDIRLNIAEYLYKELGSEAFRPPEVLRRMVKGGKAGKKNRRGFMNGIRRNHCHGQWPVID